MTSHLPTVDNCTACQVYAIERKATGRMLADLMREVKQLRETNAKYLEAMDKQHRMRAFVAAAEWLGERQS